MPTTDSRVDEYINQSAEFAIPVLTHIRTVVHKACPSVIETIKWGFPNFDYNGKILCSMASFKQHCAFSFWLGSLMQDPEKLLFTGADKTAMGHLRQLKSEADLPSDKIFISYILEAMALNKQGVKVVKKNTYPVKKTLEVPDYFISELNKNRKAMENFEAFSYSNKKEYLEWITEAKTEATRNKRMANAIEWIREGKERNWKYQAKK